MLQCTIGARCAAAIAAIALAVPAFADRLSSPDPAHALSGAALVRALRAEPVKAGELRVITSHGNPFRAVAGPPHLEEGEAAVLKPGGSDFVVVARIKRGDWASFATAER